MIAALKLLAPSLIAGAVEIIKDKQARKENLTRPSTAAGSTLLGTAITAAISPEVASQAVQAIGMPADTLEGYVTQIMLGIGGIILIMLRKGKAGAANP